MTLVKVKNPINRSFDGLMNDLFNDLPVQFSKSIREDVLYFPPANITEKNEKNDFKIELDGKMLTISTEKKQENSVENEKIIRREFSHKAFSRSFTLDEKIDAAGISARYENGILVLSLPKKEEEKKITKAITIQ
jgi:HSP20 family protein